MKAIEDNLDGYPKVGSILSSDGTTGHAIGVMNGWIFDSNLTHAMEITQANLDWCSSADNDATKFKKFHKIYVFVKNTKMGVSAEMTRNGPLVKQYIRPPSITEIDSKTHALPMSEGNQHIKKKKAKNKKQTVSEKSEGKNT